MVKKNKSKKKKKRQPKQSLTKNTALFFLSLCVLVGASFLFTSIAQRPELPLNPFNYEWKKLLKKPLKEEGKPAQPESKENSIGAVEYTFYDILYHQDNTPATSDYHYTIQIAAFRTTHQADTFVKELRQNRKLKCKVTCRGKWSCVRWGSFPTKAAAERYRKKLSSMLKRDCMVVKI